MSKLIVNNPQGVQEVLEVGQSGSYFDNDLVIWDERVHGIFSRESELGGLVPLDEVVVSENPYDPEHPISQVVRRLTFDAVKKSAQDSVSQTKIDTENTKRAALLALKNRIDVLDGQTDLTAAEVKESFRKLLKFIKIKGLLEV